MLHTTVESRKEIPPTIWKKQEIANFLEQERHNLPVPLPSMVELLKIVKKPELK